jgi:uncharacterized protein YvpB
VKKILDIKYNSQRDNPAVAGVPWSSQCGYTSVAMMLSAFLPEADSDKFVAELVRRMETPGPLLDRILAKVPWARGKRTGMFGDAYAAAVAAILEERAPHLRAVWIPTGGTAAQLQAAIDAGSPANLSTMLTEHGHYIPVIGYDRENWICNDPHGNALTGYANPDGHRVRYPRAYLEAAARRSDPNKRGLRFLSIRRF